MKIENKNNYKHLSSEERDKIAILRAQGYSLNKIAKMINRNKSTISRELRRNSSSTYDVYLPHKANQRAKSRKQLSGKRPRLKNLTVRTFVINKLKLGWSPELIAGSLPLHFTKLAISHEAIYQYIYDKHIRKQDDLTTYLVRSHKKRYNRGHSRKHKKSHIPNRISIEERPKHIENRIQPGHWEADSVVSRQSKPAIAVLVERKSRFILLEKLLRKTSQQFSSAISSRLIDYPKHLRRTITYDNGSENVDHEIINKRLLTKSFFCNPYRSWEKGSVENAIGLVRRFLPKKTDFAKLSYQELARIEYLLNSRPRKCLKFRTPLQVFNSCVALPR